MLFLRSKFRYPIFIFKGKLEDGRLVAVKKLSLDTSWQGESEFLAEVRTITSIQHKNLVRLLGCCSEGPHRQLVYEFMKNGSLDLILYGITFLPHLNLSSLSSIWKNYRYKSSWSIS